MLVDTYYQGGSKYKAHVRCTIDDCFVETECNGSIEERYDKLNKLANARYDELADERFVKGFKRNKVFVPGNFIELRNGRKYKIYKGKLFEEDCIYAKRLKSDGTLYKNKTDLIYCAWDKYCFYGVNATMDIVKVYDKDMNLLAEREHLNVLSTQDFILDDN